MPLVPIRWVLIQDPKGKFETQALLCTDLAAPRQILQWFRQRWQVEVSFEEGSANPSGVETQRQWSSLAIERTTPRSPWVVLNCHNPYINSFGIILSSCQKWQVSQGNRLSPMHSRLAVNSLADADFSDVHFSIRHC